MIWWRRLLTDARRLPRTVALHVTALAARRVGATIIVMATVDRDPPWYLYWLVDGVFTARTVVPTLTLARPQACTLEALVSRSGELDVTRIINGRRPVPRWLTLFWVRPDEAVEHYRLELATGESGGAWTEFARVTDDGSWSYRQETPPLDDLTWYRFRVVPVRNGNDGTPTEWAARRIVRVPNAPGFAVSYSAATGKVTFAEG